jgi:nucleoside-triphosphatase THEP1
MQLAFIHARTPGSIDATLRDVAAELVRQGRRLAGVVQEPVATGARHRCDMELIELASGWRLPVSQTLGAGSTGCRLDGVAITAVAAMVEADLASRGADLLILNRFGKIEAAGRGFRPLIASALQRGIPVLVGVNDLNRPAFDAFAADLAVELPDLPAAVLGWAAPILCRAAAA